MTLGGGLLTAGALIATAGVVIAFAASRTQWRRFWPFGSAISCAGLAAAGAGDLIRQRWLGWIFLLMASVLLAVIAKLATAAPGVR